MPFSRLTLAALTAALLLGLTGAALVWQGAGAGRQLAEGRRIYADFCAGCHGTALEGQPDWQTPLPSGRLPAPPHDASGHTWHHADDLLRRIIRDGTAAVVGGGYQSDMPGFGDVLDEAEIEAVLAFLKSSWPARERAHQEALSRGN